MKINILGVPHKVKEVKKINESCEGTVQGIIYHEDATILLKKSMPKDLKESVLYHEIVHGILVSLGYNDLSTDETFVQGFSNALYQMFKLRKEMK